MNSPRPPFVYHLDFPYEPRNYWHGVGLLKSVVLGLAFISAVLIVAAYFGPAPAPPAPAATGQ